MNISYADTRNRSTLIFPGTCTQDWGTPRVSSFESWKINKGWVFGHCKVMPPPRRDRYILSFFVQYDNDFQLQHLWEEAIHHPSAPGQQVSAVSRPSLVTFSSVRPLSVRTYWDRDLSSHLCWNKEGISHQLNTWPRDSPHQKQLRQSCWLPAGNRLNPHCPSPFPPIFYRISPAWSDTQDTWSRSAGWLTLPWGGLLQL